MEFNHGSRVRLPRDLVTFGIAACWSMVVWVAAQCAETAPPQLSRQALSVVSGGQSSDEYKCCGAGTTQCPGTAGGCQNSKNTCAGNNSCPLSGKQAKKLTGGGYTLATCKKLSGSLGTTNKQAIQCYDIVTCPQTCTMRGAFFRCDAGAFVQNGPNFTPTEPDNTVCP